MSASKPICISAATIAIVLILSVGCGDDAGPNEPIRLYPNGIIDQVYLNTCRHYFDNYVYDDCSKSNADSACVEFGYDSATEYLCSLKVCDGYDTTFMVRVTCWKPSNAPGVPLPDSVIDSVVRVSDR